MGKEAEQKKGITMGEALYQVDPIRYAYLNPSAELKVLTDEQITHKMPAGELKLDQKFAFAKVIAQAQLDQDQSSLQAVREQTKKGVYKEIGEWLEKNRYKLMEPTRIGWFKNVNMLPILELLKSGQPPEPVQDRK